MVKIVCEEMLRKLVMVKIVREEMLRELISIPMVMDLVDTLSNEMRLGEYRAKFKREIKRYKNVLSLYTTSHASYIQPKWIY